MRHYLIDFGAGLGSATRDMKGPHEGGQHLVEFGRSLAAALSLGSLPPTLPVAAGRVGRGGRRSTPAIAWYPAETFDVEAFRTNRKVPAHKRMTDRDAYWGAKVVTSFTDAQLAAVAAAARLDARETTYLVRALRARRDIIGRRYLTAMTAVESPVMVADAGPARASASTISRSRAATPRRRASATASRSTTTAVAR